MMFQIDCYSDIMLKRFLSSVGHSENLHVGDDRGSVLRKKWPLASRTVEMASRRVGILEIRQESTIYWLNAFTMLMHIGHHIN
jgi:hypothetical protein